MLGLNETALLNLPIKHIISHESWKNLKHQTYFLTQETIITAEYNIELVGKNKNIVFTLASISRIFDESGSTLYYIVQVQDISSRKAVEEKIKSANIGLQGRLKELNNHTTESNLLTEMRGLLQSCLTLEEAVIPISKYELKLSDCWGLRRSQPYYLQEVNSEICCNHVQLTANDIRSYICILLSAQGETFGLIYHEVS